MGTKNKTVDLILRISVSWGTAKPALEFVATFSSGFSKSYPQRIQLNQPEEFRANIFQRFEDLQERFAPDGSLMRSQEVVDEFKTIGYRLFNDLFPKKLYARMLEEDVKSLVLYSEEAWVPWELLRNSGDDFFCMNFAMSRWLTPKVEDAFEPQLIPFKSIQRMVAMEAGAKKDLANAGRELQFLKELGDELNLAAELLPSLKTRDFVVNLKTGSFDLLHFAGHGEQDAQLILEDGALRDIHFPPESQDRVRELSPFIFFNACQVGQTKTSLLTGLEGFAPLWILGYGCSGYLAPIWSVDDRRANDFAKSFYNNLRDGKPLAESVRLARHALRDDTSHGNNHETTWLAYCLFGHPNAEIVFGGTEKGQVHQEELDHPLALEDNTRQSEETTQNGSGDIKEEKKSEAPQETSVAPEPLLTKGRLLAAAIFTVGILLFFTLKDIRTSSNVELDLIVSHVNFTVEDGNDAVELFNTHLDSTTLTFTKFGRFEMTPDVLRAWGGDEDASSFSRDLIETPTQVVLTAARERGANVNLEARGDIWERALERLRVRPGAEVELSAREASGDTLELTVDWNQADDLKILISHSPFLIEAGNVEIGGAAMGLAGEEVYWLAHLPTSDSTIPFVNLSPNEDRRFEMILTVPTQEELNLLSSSSPIPVRSIDFFRHYGEERRVTSLAGEGRMEIKSAGLDPIKLSKDDVLLLEDIQDFQIREIIAQPETGHLHLRLNGRAKNIRSGPTGATEEHNPSLLQKMHGPPWTWFVAWLLACLWVARKVEHLTAARTERDETRRSAQS